jgi:hypothetical protein
MTRGGKREGSGRKLDPNKKVKKTITIRPQHLEWIHARGEKASAMIEKALDSYINLYDL